MREFVELDSQNIVLNIVSVDENDCLNESGIFDKNVGIEYLKKIFPDKRFVYFDKESQIEDGSIDFTLVNANNHVIGGQYLENIDKVSMTQPYGSWTLDTQTAKWNPPIPLPSEPPNEGYVWAWNEDKNCWVNY